jgi:hypothetical protein
VTVQQARVLCYICCQFLSHGLPEPLAVRAHDGTPARCSRAAWGVLYNSRHARWPPRSTLGTPTHPCVCSSCWQRGGTSPSHCGCLSGCPQLQASVGGPRWDASRRVLNRAEDTLSTCYINIPSAITHNLNVPGHVLVWYVELVSKICPSFSVITHIYISLIIMIYFMWATLWRCQNLEY